MNKLMGDIVTLTSLPKGLTKDIVPVLESAVAHRVYESYMSDEDVTQIDIGIGLLYIKNDGTLVKYRFVPSKNLEEEIAKVFVSRESPIERRLEKALLDKLEKAYKGLV